MIWNANEVHLLPEFSSIPVDTLKRKLDALEAFVRKYTNNNYQNRFVRFTAPSFGSSLGIVSSLLGVGDTLQVTASGVNNGLYAITAVGEEYITVDQSLYEQDKNLVTKVEYPLDIKEGVLNLLRWEVENRDKVGIKSETISRHSVTYYDADASNQVGGYPISLVGFLDNYKKARF